MKFLIPAALLLAFPVLVFAQTASSIKAPVKTVTKTSKSAGNKDTAARRSALKAVEEITPMEDDTNVKLTEADIELAKRVYVGIIPCELGKKVLISANEKRPGFFVVETKTERFSMHPVESRTGAIRLEDPRQGAVWLQLGNKSMLMNQSAGLRIADECQTAEQVAFAEEMKKNPPKSLFEGADAPANTKSTEVATQAAAPAPASTAKKPVKK